VGRPGDRSLVDAARQRDTAAFEALLRPLIEPGYRLAYTIVVNQCRMARRSRWWSVAR